MSVKRQSFSLLSRWHDIPAEVKRIIFSNVIDENKDIVYIPRDRRFKVDKRHQSYQRFVNLLLVCKSFITPLEFASAIFSRGFLKLQSANEYRRFVQEVDPVVRATVRNLLIEYTVDFRGQTSFTSWSRIEDSLSTNFPSLNRVAISTKKIPYVEIGATLENGPVLLPTHQTVNNPPRLARSQVPTGLWQYYLSQGTREPPAAVVRCGRVAKANLSNLQYATADYLGNQWTRSNHFKYNETFAWIRRLFQYCKGRQIKAEIRVTLAIHRHVLANTWHRSEYVQTWCLPAICDTTSWVLRARLPHTDKATQSLPTFGKTVMDSRTDTVVASTGDSSEPVFQHHRSDGAGDSDNEEEREEDFAVPQLLAQQLLDPPEKRPKYWRELEWDESTLISSRGTNYRLPHFSDPITWLG